MKKLYFLLFALFLTCSSAFALSSIDVYEKLSALDAILMEPKVSRPALTRAYSEAKAAEDSYSLNHKDKLTGYFALAMVQYGAAKAVIEAGMNDPAPLNAAQETMKKIRKMIRGK